MKLLDRMCSAKINRRDFLKGSAAATTAVASLFLAGCGETTITTTEEQTETESTTVAQEVPVDHVIPEDVEKQGKWVSAACWHNCGGRCLNKVLVVDGVIVRQKTDDTHPDSLENPQQRACLRGRSQRKQCLGADRLKYPMKRKNWSMENPNGQLRGQDEWERITWEEAMDLVADAAKKTVANHGSEAILNADIEYYVSTNEIMKPIYAAFGGCTTMWSTWSLGSYNIAAGFLGCGCMLNTNDFFDMKNTEVFFVIGSNTAWSSAGNTMWRFMSHANKNAKYIYVDPMYNDTAALFGAEWLPIRPATDTALLLGIAYAMLQQDAEKSLIDWDFLNRCASGFDAEHMPEGADPKENFKDYVLGTYDGIPKTPAWAEEICGISSARIEQLAVELGKNNKVAIYSGWAAARSNRTDSYPQMLMTLGAMGGHFGKPGHACGNIMHGHNFGVDSLRFAQWGSNGLPWFGSTLDRQIGAPQLAKALLEKEYDDIGDGCAGPMYPAVKRKANIRMIMSVGTSNGLQTRENMMEVIEGYKTVDCVVSTGHFMNASCKYADIVLPVQTRWEWENGSLLFENNDALFASGKVIEPYYEAMNDQDIGAMLAERLDLDPVTIWPISKKQQFFNSLVTCTYADETMTYHPICTVTEEDLKNWGVEGTTQEGVIGLDEFVEKGYFAVPRKDGDGYPHISYEAFVNDPEGHPLATASGKFEIHCQGYADRINSFGWGEIKPIPTYMPVIEGYEDTFSDWENKVKGEYPYQVFTPHYLRRSHTIFENVGWLREAWENPVFINASDAAAEGIAHGDTVLITSKHGKTLRHATVTERIMPGTIGLPHGAWIDIDEKTGIDRGGSDNVLGGAILTTQGVSNYNTVLVKIEKYAGEALPKDVDRPIMMFED